MEVFENNASNQRRKRVLIAGYGYVGSLVGQRLAEQGMEVIALSRRRPVSLISSTHPGIRWVQADLTCRESLSVISGDFDYALYAASSSQGGSQDYTRIYCQGLQNIIHRLEGHLKKKMIYLSSTGVYGQDDGEWVDEEMPTRPPSETGKILLQAEEVLKRQDSISMNCWVIMRLSGIYGPGRSYAMKRIQDGTAVIESSGKRWVNMIHRHDAASAVISAMHEGVCGHVYNTSDAQPVLQSKLYAWLAKQTGSSPLPKLDTDSVRPIKRRATNKRIRSEKLSGLKGFVYKYPTYREGYLELMDSENSCIPRVRARGSGSR